MYCQGRSRISNSGISSSVGVTVRVTCSWPGHLVSGWWRSHHRRVTGHGQGRLGRGANTRHGDRRSKLLQRRRQSQQACHSTGNHQVTCKCIYTYNIGPVLYSILKQIADNERKPVGDISGLNSNSFRAYSKNILIIYRFMASAGKFRQVRSIHCMQKTDDLFHDKGL